MMKKEVVIDIDGCLNHYPAPLKMWAEVWLNLDQTNATRAIKKHNDFDLLKKTYRLSNIFHYFLPRDGVNEVLEKIKKSGCLVTLLTARNPNKNPNIRSITVQWLKKYQIPFDSVIFTKDKSTYIKQHEDRIIMVVEDEPNIHSFEKLKIEVAIFKNGLTRDSKYLHFHSVSSWKEIGRLFDRANAKYDTLHTV